MTDEELIAYCEDHSHTHKALFHRDSIRRLLRLAGNPPCVLPDREFMEAYPEVVRQLCKEARLLLGTKGGSG